MMKFVIGVRSKGLRCCTGIFTLLTVSACTLPTVDPLELPPQVAAAVPSDINLAEVNRDPEGCYFYTFASELILIRDFDGQPICIKPQ